MKSKESGKKPQSYHVQKEQCPRESWSRLKISIAAEPGDIYEAKFSESFLIYKMVIEIRFIPILRIRKYYGRIRCLTICKLMFDLQK